MTMRSTISEMADSAVIFAPYPLPCSSVSTQEGDIHRSSLAYTILSFDRVLFPHSITTFMKGFISGVNVDGMETDPRRPGASEDKVALGVWGTVHSGMRIAIQGFSSRQQPRNLGRVES